VSIVLHQSDSDIPAFAPRHEYLLFASVILLQLLPLMFFHYFPTWDGPAHLAAAEVIAHYNDPSRAMLRKYFLPNMFPSPNLTGHAILIGLAKVLPPVAAEKVLIALIIVLTSVSMRFALVSINGRARFLSYLAPPFAISWFLHAGQYNFCLSVIVFFFTIGYWLRRRERFTVAPRLILSVLLVLAYFSHIVGLAVSLVFIGSETLWLSVLEVTAHGTPPALVQLIKTLWTRGKGLLLSIVPALLLVAAYIRHGSSGAVGRYRLWDLIKCLVTLAPAMVSFSKSEYLPSVLLSGTILGLAVYSLKSFTRQTWPDVRNGLLLATGVTTILYFALPDAMNGGSYISPRLSVFVYFGVLLWSSQFEYKLGVQNAGVYAGIIAAVGLTVLHIPKYAAFNDDLAEYLSFGPRLPQGSTILPLFYISEGSAQGGTAYSLRTRPLDTSAGYLMATRNVIDLAHYESAFNYFITRFRPELDPFRFIGHAPDWQQTIPPAVSFLHYSDQTTGQVDYVFLWGMKFASDEVLANPSTQSVRSQLDIGYQLIFVSKPRELLQVYAPRRVCSLKRPE